MKTVSRTDKKALENTSAHESIALSIDSSALVHIMGVLTNLYSQPHTAILREYVSNAIDSHTKSKINTPIDITLPTYGSRFLVVRDYGAGMSKEDITNVYSRYGTSTKRDNNDEIGGFGLGAKSALAIASRFDVVSIKDGLRLDFYVEKNIQGAGLLYFVSEEATTEPSGVEVTIPYADYTFDTAFVNDFFVGFPSGTLRINGVISTTALNNEEKFTPIMGMTNEDNAGWYEIASQRSRGNYNETNLLAVIGGVKYVIQDTWINKSKFNHIAQFAHRIFLNIPIGSVDLTPSREELLYSDKTKNILEIALRNFVEAIEVHFTANVNRAKTPREAVEMNLAIRDMGYWQSDGLKWRGKIIPEDFVTADQSVLVSSSNYRGATKNTASYFSNYTYAYRNYFQGDTYDLIVLNDGLLRENSVLARRHARMIREMTGKERVIIVSKKDYDNDWFAFAHNEEYPTVSKLIEVVKVYAKNERKRIKEENGVLDKAPAAKKVVAYFLTSKDDGTREIERIYAKDERLAELNKNKTVYYMKQDRSRSSFPWFSHDDDNDIYTITQRDNARGMFGFARKIIGDTPIFLLNSRVSIEKFTTEYPSAQEIEPLVRAYALEHYEPESNYTFNEVMTKLQGSYTMRSRVDRLILHYKTLEERGLLAEVHNQKFLQVREWINLKKSADASHAKDATPEEIAEFIKVEERKANLSYWAGYVKHNDADLNEVLTEKASSMAEVAESFFLITTSEAGDHLVEAKLRQIINYINLVAE
jgi:hypothetical protein